MNLKKRLTAALLSAALALSLVACGSPATQESPSTACFRKDCHRV